jgi:RIO kinase 1
MTPLEQEVLLNLLESFLDDSLITEVLEVVQGGKEATVFRCRAAPLTGRDFVAAKVYRPMERRNFRNDAMYQQGRVILNARTRRAYQKRTDFGRDVQYGRWVNSEYATQQTLFNAGADVPEPIACNGSAIVMEWLGTDDCAAVQLRHARFEQREAIDLHDRLMSNIELMLRNNVIHGDLSPFNVLYLSREQGVRIIDFPQAVDPRENRNACELLFRDVDNISRFFEKFGVRSDPGRFASRLWKQFVHAEL